jgi:hypothetical protein
VRVGKVALWIAQSGREDWQEQLLDALDRLKAIQPQWKQAQENPA